MLIHCNHILSVEMSDDIIGIDVLRSLFMPIDAKCHIFQHIGSSYYQLLPFTIAQTYSISVAQKGSF